MSIKSILQGKWLGHPLHPALVHLPVGLFPAAVVFDLVSRLGGGSEAAVRAAGWCVMVGLIAAVVAAPAGLADWWDIKPEKPARKLGWYHMILNGVVLVLFAVSLWLRLGQPRDAQRVAVAPMVLAMVGVVVLLISGYLGGRMVFDQGIGVATHSKKKWRKIAEKGNARLPAE